MKKFLIALALTLCATSAFAQGITRGGGTGQKTMSESTPVVLPSDQFLAVTNTFAAQSSTGATAAYDTVHAVAYETIELIVTGGPATCTYRLQGSSDNSTWFNISAADITCTATTVAFDGPKAARFVRGNLLTLTGGTSPTVTLKFVGY